MQFETTFQQIIPRTHDVTSFRFPRPAGLDYKPGQFFFITLKQGDKELSKHFSFSSSPTEKDHIEFTKKITDHEYSLALKAAKVGDWARIDAPYGQFTFEGEYPKIALLGGGTVSYTHLRAHETRHDLVCRLLLEKKKKKKNEDEKK